MHGEVVEFGSLEHLVADAVDLLNIANWQRAGRKVRAPKPIKRPKPRGDRANT